MAMLTSRILKTAAQVVVLGAAIAFLVRAARPNWGTLTHLPQRPAWGVLLVGSALWLSAYTGLVLLWTESLRWWGARVPPRRGLRVFFLTNLARYVPGAIWQFAGLAAWALEEGISPAAVGGAVLLQQIVLLATGLLLVLVTAPSLLSPRATSVPLLATVVVALTGLGGLLLLFPVVLPLVKRQAERWTRRVLPLPHASTTGFAGYLLATIVGWLAYGMAFSLFAHAFLGPAAPPTWLAISAFVAAYIAGILAVFAPGGLVVREAALVAALTPHVGPEHALFLAVGSRVWLTALEILGTLGIVLTTGSHAQGLRSTNTN